MSASLVLLSRTTAASVGFASTSAFDAGVKGNPGDGNFNTETTTDNPGIAVGHLELGSLKGDAFNLPNSDANTFKWGDPTGCTVKGPSTIVRSIAGGVLDLGSGKNSSATQVGVVTAAGVTGDFTSSIEVIKVATQPRSLFDFQILNTPSCQWQGKKGVYGVIYEWDEGTAVDGTFLLRAYTVSRGAATLVGTATTLTLPAVWLQVSRAGISWSFSYSPDGSNWTQGAAASFALTGPFYPSLSVTDPKGGVTTVFHADNYDLSSGTLTSGGYRNAGNWTSATFAIPSGEVLDRVEIAGSFTGLYALDQVQILRDGVVVESSTVDNTLVVPAAGSMSGPGFSIRLFLKGDGLGTPSVTGVTAYFGSIVPVSSESVTLGYSTGIAAQGTVDGVSNAKTEALTGPDVVVDVSGQTIVRGTQASGSFPTDISASDGTSIQYAEASSQSVSAYKQGFFTRKTDGPGTQTLSGVGFQGRALLLWWTRQSTFGKGTGLSSGIGFAASPAQQYSIAWAADNGASPSNTARHSSLDLISILLNGTPALDGAADLAGFTSDGFTLQWTVNPNPAQGTIIHYIVLGPAIQQASVGQFVGPAAGFTGPRSYTGVGFQGDAAIFLASMQTDLGDSTGGGMAFGAATGTMQAGMTLAMPDQSTTNPARSFQTNQRVLVMEDPSLSTPTVDQQAAFASFDADGFTLNHTQTTAGGVLFWALVLKGGGYGLNYFVRQAKTGPQSVTGTGFQPDGVIIFSDMSTKLLGKEDTGAEMSLGAGTVVAGVPIQDNTWGGQNDVDNPTHANEFTTTAQVITDLSLTSTGTQNTAKYVSSDPDGFTLNWTAVQSNATQKFFYLAIQSETPSGVLDVRYDWPSLGYRSSQDVLAVQGYVGDEALIAQVWNWTTSSWDAALLLDSTSEVTAYHVLAAGEISPSLEVLVRFIDANRTADLVPSSFWLDYVAIEKHEFQLAVVEDISGLSGTGPFSLTLVGSLGSSGDNFDVLVYNYSSASWDPWLSAPFTGSEQTFRLTLDADQVSGGTVQVLLVDHGTLGVQVAGVLLVDLLDVEALS